MDFMNLNQAAHGDRRRSGSVRGTTARMAGTEPLLIDAGTTRRSFETEIRANAAHYRLARGL